MDTTDTSSWCIAGSVPNQGFMGKCTHIAGVEGWRSFSAPGMPLPAGSVIRIHAAVTLYMQPVPVQQPSPVRGGQPGMALLAANGMGLPFILSHEPLIDVAPTWVIWFINLHSQDISTLVAQYENLARAVAANRSNLQLPGVQ